MSHELVCGAVDVFIDACQPCLSQSPLGSIHRENTPRSSSVGSSSISKQFSASSFNLFDDSSVCSPLSRAYMTFAHLLSLASSNCEKKISPSSVPAHLMFPSTENCSLASDQQASNCVQIIYRKSAVAELRAADTAESRTPSKVSRKIYSHPISLASFCAKFCVKDLSASDVACVELVMHAPGSTSSDR